MFLSSGLSKRVRLADFTTQQKSSRCAWNREMIAISDRYMGMWIQNFEAQRLRLLGMHDIRPVGQDAASKLGQDSVWKRETIAAAPRGIQRQNPS